MEHGGEIGLEGITEGVAGLAGLTILHAVMKDVIDKIDHIQLRGELWGLVEPRADEGGDTRGALRPRHDVVLPLFDGFLGRR